jgi:FkbH-like protein
MLQDFTGLKKNLKKDFSKFRKIKIAVLGDSATQFLTVALKGHGYEVGFDFDLFEADYDQIELQVFDPQSDLYKANPDFIVLFCSVQKLKKKFYKSDKSAKLAFSDSYIRWVESIQAAISGRLSAKIICLNFPELNDSVFGNFANKTELSFVYQLRTINYSLMNLAVKLKNIFICDVCAMQSYYGRKFMFDPNMYMSADMVFSLDFLPVLAKNISDIVLSVTGVFKKCLILDLDNTMWGGIIGDDGLENIQLGDLGTGKAFTELQLWAKQLKERGIILAVCSKNNEAAAKEPFESHPDMVLRLGDIAVFVANWNNKADNIRYIQNILNIGFDSMVFLDDNPFERNLVRTNIPQITVPELSENPGEYLEYLQTLNLFETASFSQEDEIRTQHYQDEAKRAVALTNFTDENEFLASLQMVSTVKPFDKFTMPRVSQLSQRSNQFNLRTVRYTEAEIEKIAQAEEYITASFTLVDKYGDNGLICMLVLKQYPADILFIETWLMSCRVLKRGMENFTLNAIVGIAKERGIKKIVGEYLPTAKNGMVKDHYLNLGFTRKGDLWELETQSYHEKEGFISRQ